jgi:hypothetical protein
MSVVGTFEICRPALRMSANRGAPESRLTAKPTRLTHLGNPGTRLFLGSRGLAETPAKHVQPIVAEEDLIVANKGWDAEDAIGIGAFCVVG